MNKTKEIINELEELIQRSKEEEIVVSEDSWSEGYIAGKTDAYEVALSLVQTLL